MNSVFYETEGSVGIATVIWRGGWGKLKGLEVNKKMYANYPKVYIDAIELFKKVTRINTVISFFR